MAGRELKLAISIAGRLDKSLGAAANAAQAQLNSISKAANKYATRAAVAIGAATVKLVSDSIKTYTEYEDAVNSAAAVFDVKKGTAQYETIANAAREVGRTTVKSAKEGAQALEYMALAGWSVEDSQKALIPVVKLSASTGMDLATTSDLITDTMAAMGIGINDLGHYMDVVAKANNSANYTSQMLLESFTNAGGVFRSLNIGAEDGAAVLGVLANQGTKGSEAGTQLNTVLTRMQKQSGESAKGMEKLGLSMFDAAGNTRNIIDVFEDMYDATKNMTDEERNQAFTLIGGTRGYRALTKIMSGFKDTTAEGIPVIRALAGAYRDADGALDAFYDIKTDTLGNAATRLKRLYEDMQLSIGAAMAPRLNELIEHMADNMPEIENVIVGMVERAAPHVSAFLDFVISNMDKIVDGAGKFMKIFAGLKIGSGALRGITNLTTLFQNLHKLGAARGFTNVLKGIIGSFTGVSTAAGSAGGVVTGFFASLVPYAAVIGGIALAAYGAKKAYDAWYTSHYRWGEGLVKQADAIGAQANELSKLTGYKKELQNLQLVINSPSSSTEQIAAAQDRIREITGLLNEEYNLSINTDNADLSKVAEDAKIILEALHAGARDQFNKDFTNYMTDLNDKAGGYRDAVTALPQARDDAARLDADKRRLSDIHGNAVLYQQAYERSGKQEYLDMMSGLAADITEYGFGDEMSGYSTKKGALDQFSGAEDIEDFILAVSSVYDDVQRDVTAAEETLKNTTDNINNFEKSASLVSAGLAEALSDDFLSGDIYSVETDISRFEELGKILVEAGASTREAGTNFAMAKEGFTDFSEAVGAGLAQKMADNFTEYSRAIGESAENTAVGAALIANGFNDISAAAAAGDNAVNNIINDLYQRGSMEGLFDGLDTDGILNKLNEIAHAIGLIPDGKSIGIDANGNFSVITEAQDQLQRLETEGSVDITLNADGDISLIDKATGDIQTIENTDAVNMQLNANGDIEVLNEANEVMSTIDKNAQVNVDGHTSGIEELQTAAEASEGLEDISVTEEANGAFNEQEKIATALEYQEKLDDVNVTYTVNGIFNGQDKIATALSYQSQLADKTVTYKVNYEQSGTPPGHTAAGAYSWRGGLTYVNDQKGIANPTEVIEHKGIRYWYEGKNVLADVPKGARIYTAAQSRQFIDGSHRNGLERVPFDGYIAELHQGERVLTSDEASEYNGGKFNDYLDILLDFLDTSPSVKKDSSSGGEQIVFSPQITITGNADEKIVIQAMKIAQKEFEKMYKEMKRDERRKVF